jgi:hypothetical protein
MPLWNQNSLGLNEHGSALKVFWTRNSELGAQSSWPKGQILQRQVKANHMSGDAKADWQTGLDELRRNEYSERGTRPPAGGNWQWIRSPNSFRFDGK